MKKWLLLGIIIIAIALIWINRPNTAEAACTGCGEGGHGTCIEAPGHTHDNEVDHEHEDGVWLDHKHDPK